MLLLLLAAAITLNLLRAFELPTLGGRAQPAGSFGTGALAAFIATPCAGPFLGAALGTALLLPLFGAVLVFAALGFGLALPFLLVAVIPMLRNRLPKPGAWMARLQRFLAIPMAASAVAALWLLYRLGGQPALIAGLAWTAVLLVLLVAFGFAQRSGRNVGIPVATLALVFTVVAIGTVPKRSTVAASVPSGAEAWTETRVAADVQQGKPVFVYFTADWCLTCKANEVAAIDRDEVREAFRREGARRRLDQRRSGDHAVPRKPRARRRAALPLVFAEQGTRGTAAGADAIDAHFPRSTGEALGARSHTFFPATHVSNTCVRASSCGFTLVGSRSMKTKSAHLPGSRAPILSSAKPA
jgi:hypothetical protein